MGINIGTGYGSVMVGIISPTRMVLVIQRVKTDPRWKLPGGKIEQGESILEAAIREVKEETGIELSPGELEHRSGDRYEGKVYYPHFCIARVDELKIDERIRRGFEDGEPIETAIFERAEPATMPDLLERHRAFVKTLEGCR